MATTAVTLNGTTYFVPQPGEQGPTYDQDLTNYLVALATAFPQGGASPSSTFQALISAGANPATAGRIRLANADLVEFRNVGNTGNDILGLNANDDLQYTNGTSGLVYSITGAPYLEATLTSTQSGIAATPTTVIFNNKLTDTDTAYNAGTGIFTVPAGKGGIYAVCVSVNPTQNTSAGIQQLQIQANSIGVQAQWTSAAIVATNLNILAVSALVNVAAGQQIFAQLATTAGTISLVSSNFSRLQIKKLV